MTRRELLGRTLMGAQVTLLAACGGDDEDEAEQPRAAPTAPQASVPKLSRESVVLTLAASRGGGPTFDAIRQWNEGNVPGVPDNVELQDAKLTYSTSGNLKTTQDALASALTARVSAGTIPDMMAFDWQIDFPWLFKINLLQPLDRLMQQDDRQPAEQFFPQAAQLVRYQGQTMALPTRVTAGVVRYLPDMFSSANVAVPHAGWTRDDFVTAAKQLTQDTNGDGAVDQWGFAVSHYYPDWLPFVLHETGKDVIDLETGAVHLADPAALRGLQVWDELGRVHGILPYGQEILANKPRIRGPYRPSRTGILFQTAFETSQTDGRNLAAIPTGVMEGTPLILFDIVAIPAVARDVDLSYEALVPLALHSGERSKLPTVKASLQHIMTPGSRDHINLLFHEQDREIILNILETAQPSYLASSNAMNSWLFANLTLPLARGEIGVEQAAQQAQNWLESYLNE